MPTPSTAVIDYAAMETLTAQFKQIDTSSAFSYSGFSSTLSDIVTAVKKAFPDGVANYGILVCVDTLFMDVSAVTFETPSLTLVARSIQVITTDHCKLQIQFDDALGIQVVTQEITGLPLLGMIVGLDNTPVTDSLQIAVPPPSSALQPVPYLLQITLDQPSQLQASNKPTDVGAGLAAKPTLVALKASFVGASSLLYGTSDQQLQANGMLRWVKNCCTALIPPNCTVLSQTDQQDMADLKGQSAGLLTILQYQTGSVYYVPILSTTFYQDQLSGLLTAAQAYDSALATLKQTTTLEDTLKQLAITQQGISKDAETPLMTVLKQLVSQAEDYRRQYVTTLQLYQTQLQTVKTTRQTYEQDMQKYEIFTALQFAFKILEVTASVAAVCGGFFVEDPEQVLDVSDLLLMGEGGNSAFFNTSQEIVSNISLKTLTGTGFSFLSGLQKTAEIAQLCGGIAGMLPTGDLLESGNWAAAPINDIPTVGTDALLLTVDTTIDPATAYVSTLEQNKFPTGLVDDFKTLAGIALPTDVSKITVTMTTVQATTSTSTDPPAQAEYWDITDTSTKNTYVIWPTYTKQADGSSKLTQLQVFNNSIFNKLMYDLQTIDLTNPLVPVDVPSINGQDPVAYWNSYRMNAEGELQPYTSSIPGVAPYLIAVQQLSEYGKAMAGQQKELMRLHGEALDVIARFNALKAAEQKWQDLIDSIASDDQKRAQAQSLLLQGYNDLKRSIFVAVQKYRNAYRYNWLTQPPLQITMDMNYTDLQAQCNLVSQGLEKVLQTTANGVVQPASQDFTLPIEVTIPLGKAGNNSGLPYFDSTGTISWTIKGPDSATTTASDPAAVTQQLPGLHAIYIESAMFYLDGIKPDPITNEVWVNVHTSGTYFHRLGTHGFFNFASPRFGMDCGYKLDSSGSPVPDTYWKPSSNIENLYMKASPYSTWTLKVTDGDYSNVTQIRMAFTGYYLHETTTAVVAK